jgi:hypothetical protein
MEGDPRLEARMEEFERHLARFEQRSGEAV